MMLCVGQCDRDLVPNLANIQSPLLVVGCGRTASTYVQQRLQYGQGSFQSVIENDVYRDVWSALTDRWWTPNLQHVAAPKQCRVAVIDATRQALLTMFPSDRPHWVMKMIWSNHDPDVVRQLFPNARFLHMVRDPRTNIPSMMERLQFGQRHAETAYIEANECALQFEQFGDRYLRVRQEDFVLRREVTWSRLCAFVNEPKTDACWNREVNPSASTKGSVVSMRSDSRLRWHKLRKATRACAERLGYAQECATAIPIDRQAHYEQRVGQRPLAGDMVGPNCDTAL
ncbi:MAG: hypothetical protein ACI89X_003324 [Planctomycetota bacterium]|jgi:hypothetical protein